MDVALSSSQPNWIVAGRDAGDADFDAISFEFDKLSRIPVLKARMNADLYTADDLKNVGKGNLFVIAILDVGPDGE